jgi:hypothetical protein
MNARVIQGYFAGGGPRGSALRPQPALRPAVATRPNVPGPPPPASAAHGRAVTSLQARGANDAFAIDPDKVGLANGPGRPLPHPVRHRMEAALGADFSAVRVHVGPQAGRIGAVAFTTGTDIYFAPGRYQPETAQGLQLLGHELAHVVQQRQGRVRNPAGSGVAVVRDRELEAEADRLGQMAARHHASAQAKRTTAAIQPPASARRTIGGTKSVGSSPVAQRMETLRGLVNYFAGSADQDPLEEWKRDVREIAKAHTQIGPNAGRPAAYTLIEKGPFRARDPSHVLNRVDMDPVSKALNLSREEETALYKYSQGLKDERDSPGYMTNEQWKDLKTAVNKIPSMGALGTAATVFRGDRKTDFTDFLRSRQGRPCYIVHGAAKTKAGVRHMSSAAFTLNSHGMRAHSLIRIICLSARYIQYWGMHGASLDGGEVLIPAGTISYFDGEAPHKEPFSEDRSLKDIFTLVEVMPGDVRPDIPFFDDFKGATVSDEYLGKIFFRRQEVIAPRRQQRVAPQGKEKFD